MRKFLCMLALMGFVAAVGAEDVKLKIEGMVCEVGCVGKVDSALSKIKGVEKKEVTLGEAMVSFDAKKTSQKDIVKAIEKAGFTVAKKNDKDKS